MPVLSVCATVLAVVLAQGGEGQRPTSTSTEVVVPGPVVDVWRAFTTAEGMKEWMVAHAEVDLRVGGKMLTHYDPAGKLGDPNTIENTILSLDAPRMISIKATKPPAGFPFKVSLDSMWSVLYFDEIGADQTRVRCVGHGFGADEESQKMRQFFDKGNRFTLDRLAQHFAKKSGANGDGASKGAGGKADLLKDGGHGKADGGAGAAGEAAAGGESGALAVADLSWMTGVWQGEFAAGRFEIYWAPAHADHMMGMFRLVNDEATMMLEFMSVLRTEAGVEMRVRHFSPNLDAWEEKKEPITLRLAAGDGERFEFVNDLHDRPKRVIITRQGENEYRSVAEIVRSGKTELMDLTVSRKGSIQLAGRSH